MFPLEYSMLPKFFYHFILGKCCLPWGIVMTLLVMVNFMCHLDWAMGCPDTWLNIVLGVSVRVFLDEVNIWVGWQKSRLSSPGWVGLIQSLEVLIEQKAEQERIHSLPDGIWAGISVSPAFVLRLQLTLLAFLVLTLLDCRLWDLSVFIITWPSSF